MMRIGPEHAEIVPPPKEVREDKAAAALGLPRGLRVESPYRRQFRCCNCNQMQSAGSTLVWVSDGVGVGDPAWAVTENERQNSLNGTGGGWCLRCAQKLGRSADAVAAPLWMYILTLVAIIGVVLLVAAGGRG